MADCAGRAVTCDHSMGDKGPRGGNESKPDLELGGWASHSVPMQGRALLDWLLNHGVNGRSYKVAVSAI